MNNQNDTVYVLLLEWCENSDDGKEIVCATSSRELITAKFHELVAKGRPGVELAKWTIMDDRDDKFFAHGSFPDFVEITILTYNN